MKGSFMAGKLFIISAPSGAGKTTLVQYILERLQKEHAISRVVTYTTKPARQGESVQGVDFYFVSQAEFEQKIAEGFFIEWSLAYGYYYGTPTSVKEMLLQGRSHILIVDRAGAKQIKEAIPQAVLIWIYTANLNVLKNRIEARGGESPEQIAHRLALAVTETEQEAERPYYDFHILNEDFYESGEKLYEIFIFFLNQSV